MVKEITILVKEITSLVKEITRPVNARDHGIAHSGQSEGQRAQNRQ